MCVCISVCMCVRFFKERCYRIKYTRKCFIVWFPLGNFYLFMYLLLVVLGLPCYAWAVSGCSTWGLLSRCSVWASSCDVFSCCRAQALGTQASVDTAGGLNSCGSWATDRGLSS